MQAQVANATQIANQLKCYLFVRKLRLEVVRELKKFGLYSGYKRWAFFLARNVSTWKSYTKLIERKRTIVAEISNFHTATTYGFVKLLRFGAWEVAERSVVRRYLLYRARLDSLKKMLAVEKRQNRKKKDRKHSVVGSLERSSVAEIRYLAKVSAPLERMERIRMEMENICQILGKWECVVHSASSVMIVQFFKAWSVFCRDRNGERVMSMSRKRIQVLFHKKRVKKLINIWYCAAVFSVYVERYRRGVRQAKIVADEQERLLKIQEFTERRANRDLSKANPKPAKTIERPKVVKTKPIEVVPVYRCFAPMCGGVQFPNAYLYNVHKSKHERGKTRLEKERAFIAAIRDGSVDIVSKAAPRPLVAVHDKPKFPILVLQEADDNLPPRIELRYGHTTIGRSRKCTVCIRSTSSIILSKKHCRLEVENSDHGMVVHLLDLNSMNGTYLNCTKVHARTQLRNGDIIELSNHITYRFLSYTREQT